MLKRASISNIYTKIRLLKSIGPKPEAALLRDIDAYMSFFYICQMQHCWFHFYHHAHLLAMVQGRKIVVIDVSSNFNSYKISRTIY